MKNLEFQFLRRFLRDQRCQSMAVIAVTFATIVTVAGASVETGHVYYAYRQQVASTNAATKAGCFGCGNNGIHDWIQR